MKKCAFLQLTGMTDDGNGSYVSKFTERSIGIPFHFVRCCMRTLSEVQKTQGTMDAIQANIHNHSERERESIIINIVNNCSYQCVDKCIKNK